MENNLTTAQAAAVVGLRKNTLEKFRCFGGGPPYVKIGKKSVRYRRMDLESWLETQLVSSTSEYPTSYRLRGAVNHAT